MQCDVCYAVQCVLCSAMYEVCYAVQCVLYFIAWLYMCIAVWLDIWLECLQSTTSNNYKYLKVHINSIGHLQFDGLLSSTDFLQNNVVFGPTRGDCWFLACDLISKSNKSYLYIKMHLQVELPGLSGNDLKVCGSDVWLKSTIVLYHMKGMWQEILELSRPYLCVSNCIIMPSKKPCRLDSTDHGTDYILTPTLPVLLTTLAVPTCNL